MKFQIEKATKTQAKGRIALIGPAGSGKTYTALRFAEVLKGDEKVLYIDSEARSSEKYADEFDFDIIPLEPPYSVKTYEQAIKYAGEQEGYGVVVVDSLSHAWAGEGGALEQVDQAKSKYQGNTYVAWRDVTPAQHRMVEAILQNPKHVIVCMRSKMEYSMEKDSSGKTTIKKVGLAPIQREGLDYEFDVVLDIDWDHKAIVSKTRMSSIADKVFLKPGEELAEEIYAWLTTGEAQRVPKEVVDEAEEILEALDDDDKGPRNYTQSDLVGYAKQHYGFDGKDVGAALKGGGYTSFDAENWDDYLEALARYKEMLEESDAELASANAE